MATLYGSAAATTSIVRVLPGTGGSLLTGVLLWKGLRIVGTVRGMDDSTLSVVILLFAMMELYRGLLYL